MHMQFSSLSDEAECLKLRTFLVFLLQVTEIHKSALSEKTNPSCHAVILECGFELVQLFREMAIIVLLLSRGPRYQLHQKRDVCSGGLRIFEGQGENNKTAPVVCGRAPAHKK